LYKLAADFVGEFADGAARIEAALATGDHEGARSLAHTLAGVAATLEARQVHAATVALERALDRGQPGTAELTALATALGQLRAPDAQASASTASKSGLPR
jgi:HPt (histidine-containing phosphotransfer) domain-containing protein